MIYQGAGALALGAVASGKVFTPSMRQTAISYNNRMKGTLGWKATVGGAALADAVYALQAYLFTSAREMDGKLGPKTNNKILAFAKNNKANQSVNYQSAINAVAGGAAPSSMTDNVAASIMDGMGIEGAIRGGSGGSPAPRPAQRPGSNARPPALATTVGGDNTMMYLTVAAALGIGTYFYMKKNR